MRLKCRPAELKKEQPCRLCGRPVQKGYVIRGVIKGCACEDCYDRVYGPLSETLAFHISDIFTKDFWRPLHIEDGVVMFPGLSAKKMQTFNYVIRRLLPVLLLAALILSGPDISMIQRIPGHLLELLDQLVTLIKGTGGHLWAVLLHLPPVLLHFKDAGLRIVMAVPHLVLTVIDWIRSPGGMI